MTGIELKVVVLVLRTRTELCKLLATYENEIAISSSQALLLLFKTNISCNA